MYMWVKNVGLALLLLFQFLGTKAQITQSISGRVLDADSKEPLIGVSIAIPLTDGRIMGSVTDDQGYYLVENIPIGRQRIKYEYIGYELVELANIVLTSGKELSLNIELRESAAELQEAVVSARDKSDTHNDMVTVSSRSFDAEEAERYPGSRQDPARMALNFAGVQGTDDQRNDIVVRGNSPLGLLWRYEGIDIFNPSHFAIAGTTGGPISMINNKVIGNSDFLTGAFPAEYGNGVSGVFDLHTRNGNYNKNEFAAQFGLWGTELMAEGPINKNKKSSFLFNYRYATFSIFQAVGINLGTDATPQYQDASFRLNFPSKKGAFTLFGLGGMSSIDIVFSDDEKPTEELYGLKDRDQYFRTNMGLLGATYRHYFKNKSTLNVTVAHNAQQIRSNHDKIFRDPIEYTRLNLTPVLNYEMVNAKTTMHAVINKKFSAKSSIKYGLIIDQYHINFFDSTRNENTFSWVEKMNINTNPIMARAYGSWKYRLSSKLSLLTGLHGMYYQEGQSTSIEPRVGMVFQQSATDRFSLAYGNHSQIQPLYVYYTQFVDSLSKTFGMHNRDMTPTKSHHLVASYENTAGKNLRFRTEVYYQWLYNVPVEVIASSFSLLNQGSGFQRFFPDVLENTGTGRNLGIEFTLERFFSNQFYFLSTLSLYDSKYKGSDGIERSTDFNANYMFNTLGGYEIPLGDNGKNILSFGTKVTWGGGRRFSPIDSSATKADGAKVIFLDNERNTLQFKDYLRWDLKVAYRINGAKASHEISLDIANVLDRQNVLTISYFDDPKSPGNKIFAEEYQLGRLPTFYYKIEF